MASARWGTRQSISTKHGRTKCASSQQGNNIFRSSAANLARSRCVIGKLRIIAYRPDPKWPKDFHRVLGADRLSVLRCKPVDRLRVADEFRQVGAIGWPRPL